MARNEADIGASGIFNRKNRFADFDIIHQGWKFETAFVYKFVPELRTKIERASFFVPFQKSVWIVIIWLITVLSLIYWLMDNITIRLKNKTPFIARGYIYKQRTRYQNKIYEYGRKYDDFIPEEQISLTNIALFPIAATCQQNFSSESKLGAVKITFLVMFLYSLLLYNYYTSSVVSGLLSSTAQGPSSVEEIISSSLEVSFEDIGYYKILFRENKSPIIIRFIATKLLPPRKENDLPIYTNIKNAVHFIKRGSHAFHCELVDAFPEIAKNFDANDICALRIVKGLMDSELMNGILHKNSQYTEIFRYTLSWSRESGLIGRILYNRLQRKPPCQAVYIVFPVNFSNITSICILLVGGILLSLLTSFAELYIYRYYFVRKYSMN
ncbi:unnamed protein product [Ceratitis capitata]|uniref:(Mediterranean fruit fly) hypothetical protein n=2 Tax=Ceratitis capitata TaxID=7213 RepID=A0A811UHB0_CERCA|nr:unnamed protein product [Ceratitis capitata]